MAVGLRRNPYGAQALFGYEPDFVLPDAGQPQVGGLGDVAQVDAPEPVQLVEPIAPSEMVGGDGLQDQSQLGDYVTESMIENRRRLAKALMGNQQEVNHPMQAIGNAVSQITGAWMEGKAARDEAANEKRRREAFKKAIGDGNDFDAMVSGLLRSDDPALVDKGLELRLQSMNQRNRGLAKPDVETFYDGDESVQKQWDAETGTWKELGRGRRWRAGIGGGGDDGDGGGGIAPTAQGGTFALPGGQIVQAPFVKGRGFVYRDENGQYRDLPHDARPVTNSAGGPMTAPQWLKLKQDRQEGRNALTALDQYMKVVGGLPQGVSRWANDVSAKFKTFMGKTNLTPQEFNQMDAWQKQQALIGLFRTTVVGPGVVTEYDAVRIIQALGGDPASALQNPQVLERVLGDLYQRKRAEVDILDREYQRNAPYFGEQAEPLGTPETLALPGNNGGGQGPQGASKPRGPQPGAIVNGYRFKGGNPRDKANWEKVK